MIFFTKNAEIGNTQLLLSCEAIYNQYGWVAECLMVEENIKYNIQYDKGRVLVI